MAIDENIEGTSALLTKTQREWLREPPALDPGSGQQRALRSQFRKRMIRSIYDFYFVFENIPMRDFEQIFDRLVEDPNGSSDALASMIAFVYLGTTESHLDLSKGPYDFREILSQAVTRAEIDRSPETTPLGQSVSVDFGVEKREYLDLDIQSVLGKIEDNNLGDLTSEEVYGFMDLYSRADDRSPAGMVEALEEIREEHERLRDEEYWEELQEEATPIDEQPSDEDDDGDGTSADDVDDEE